MQYMKSLVWRSQVLKRWFWLYAHKSKHWHPHRNQQLK
jgi:hypothetical protein